MLKESFNKIMGIDIVFLLIRMQFNVRNNHLQNLVSRQISILNSVSFATKMGFLRLEAIFRTCLNADDYFLRIGKNFSPR
ncbi:hypothetical protein T4B_4822 [Trichinella pseudospiralis]|uniref:Uncharacterized protein n=1 Tax=Trichinella pseudospiralis TaxID=6337 RepID=A0A0V1IUJ9_TRIPS|nr:hypothetical protein T4B_4822 [Trichinella pseudospiralis]KRZ33225.1 hypothetical protein T4C_12788 [Trichinella pseudospiralis]